MKTKSRNPYNRKLYHFTSEEGAREIERSGFAPGELGFVWLADHPKKVWGETSREVLFEILAIADDIEPFIHNFPEEVFDHTLGEWVSSNLSPEIGYYFLLPPDVANSFPRRRVSDDERHKLLT